MQNLTSLIRLLRLLVLSSVLTVPIHAGPIEVKLKPRQVYTNSPSRFQFPPLIATFQRMAKYNQYDPGDRDIGIGYNDIVSGVAATVYVYPVFQKPPADKLEGHFEGCKKAVFDKHAGTKLISEGPTRITVDGKTHDGLHATFANTEVFAQQRQPVKSELYLFMHKRIYVLFRFTYPETRQSEAETAIKAFVGDLAWPPSL